MDSKTMDALGAAADALLDARGPIYTMSKAEERRRLKALEREKGMERVYVCSQYAARGDKATNLELAKMFCMAVIEEGKIPICPHLFYGGVLNDDVKSQRAAGLRIGLELLEECDELRIFSPLSMGMKAEVLKADELGIPIVCADMSVLYSKDQAPRMEHEITQQFQEVLCGKEHNSEEN